jgi:alkanesulfonate monooxygenase SsuD/methylene tetrahydromethanopterin reductase-like flavin-dependent oxidoreductase (luciferase family)
VETVSSAYGQDFAPLAERYLLLGTPEDVLARLAEFADAGATRVLMQPACPPTERLRLIDLMAESVLPTLRTL